MEEDRGAREGSGDQWYSAATDHSSQVGPAAGCWLQRDQRDQSGLEGQQHHQHYLHQSDMAQHAAAEPPPHLQHVQQQHRQHASPSAAGTSSAHGGVDDLRQGVHDLALQPGGLQQLAPAAGAAAGPGGALQERAAGADGRHGMAVQAGSSLLLAPAPSADMADAEAEGIEDMWSGNSNMLLGAAGGGSSPGQVMGRSGSAGVQESSGAAGGGGGGGALGTVRSFGLRPEQQGRIGAGTAAQQQQRAAPTPAAPAAPAQGIGAPQLVDDDVLPAAAATSPTTSPTAGQAAERSATSSGSKVRSSSGPSSTGKRPAVWEPPLPPRSSPKQPALLQDDTAHTDTEAEAEEAEEVAGPAAEQHGGTATSPAAAAATARMLAFAAEDGAAGDAAGDDAHGDQAAPAAACGRTQAVVPVAAASRQDPISSHLRDAAEPHTAAAGPGPAAAAAVPMSAPVTTSTGYSCYSPFSSVELQLRTHKLLGGQQGQQQQGLPPEAAGTTMGGIQLQQLPLPTPPVLTSLSEPSTEASSSLAAQQGSSSGSLMGRQLSADMAAAAAAEPPPDAAAAATAAAARGIAALLEVSEQQALDEEPGQADVAMAAVDSDAGRSAGGSDDELSELPGDLHSSQMGFVRFQEVALGEEQHSEAEYVGPGHDAWHASSGAGYPQHYRMTVASSAAASRHLRCGSAATIGWRPYMEDEVVAAPEWLPARRLGLLAVFDGHGGAEAARFCAHHVEEELARLLHGRPTSELPTLLPQLFLALDARMADPASRPELYHLASSAQRWQGQVLGTCPLGSAEGGSMAVAAGTQHCSNVYGRYFLEDADQYIGPEAGCTATVVVAEGRGALYVANVGDSRAVLVRRSGRALPLTNDHKATDLQEVERVLRANGYIRRDRVCGDLDMARTLGDFEYKTNRALPPAEQIISPWPDVRTLAVSSEDLFLVLASDGLWNTMDSQQVADWLMAAWDGGRGASLHELASALARICVTSPSTSYDNTSVMLVQLNVPEGPEPADEHLH